ncbi:MAG: DUF4124 domain-containing protein [Deltaproteobacteria bacterium]|nr:MAG: DUF4124 domain-containing protein [Deltaproteobacteria bacterium]
MKGKIIAVAILILLGQGVLFPHASAEVFKWVDDKGTVHFTEDESAIPEKSRQQTEKRYPVNESAPPKEKVDTGGAKKKELTRKAPKKPNEKPEGKPEEKRRIDVRQIEWDVAGSFENIISLWKARRFEALYDCGDRKSRTAMAREDFRKRMERKSWELALSWETVRDVQVEVKNATRADVTARIGYRPKHGGETRVRTETCEMKLENGTWTINLSKVVNAPGK